MVEQGSTFDERSAPSRRTVVKGAAWSVPAIAAAIALPAAAASGCTEPAAPRGVGSWWINGPKDTAAGYVGWTANNEPGSRRYVYEEGSALDFSWVWTAASDPTGELPVGTEIRVGIGGETTLDGFWIQSFPVPATSNTAVQYTGSTGPMGNWFIFKVTAPIPAGTVITWTSTITLKSVYPSGLNIASNFGAYAQVRDFSDTAPCPPLAVARTTAAEWQTLSYTSSLATYCITNQYIKDNPGYVNN